MEYLSVFVVMQTHSSVFVVMGILSVFVAMHQLVESWISLDTWEERQICAEKQE